MVPDDSPREDQPAQPYQLELLGLKGSAATAGEAADVEVGAGELTLYDNLDAKTGEPCWGHLCRGPHLSSTRQVPACKLARH
ncbi:hypothetical protein VM98_34365, partial [Streptomyces rubellomurinus subsp. indigoferus]